MLFVCLCGSQCAVKTMPRKVNYGIDYYDDDYEDYDDYDYDVEAENYG